MPRGGYRPGAGRKKGSHITKTAAIVSKLAESGDTPLEYLLSIVNDTSQPQGTRIQCAIAAAPYVHPRLAHVQHTRPKTGALDRLYAAVEADLAARGEMITVESSPRLPSPIITDVVMCEDQLR